MPLVHSPHHLFQLVVLYVHRSGSVRARHHTYTGPLLSNTHSLSFTFLFVTPSLPPPPHTHTSPPDCGCCVKPSFPPSNTRQTPSSPTSLSLDIDWPLSPWPSPSGHPHLWSNGSRFTGEWWGDWRRLRRLTWGEEGEGKGEGDLTVWIWWTWVSSVTDLPLSLCFLFLPLCFICLPLTSLSLGTPVSLYRNTNVSLLSLYTSLPSRSQLRSVCMYTHRNIVQKPLVHNLP